MVNIPSWFEPRMCVGVLDAGRVSSPGRNAVVQLASRQAGEPAELPRAKSENSCLRPCVDSE